MKVLVLACWVLLAGSSTQIDGITIEAIEADRTICQVSVDADPEGLYLRIEPGINCHGAIILSSGYCMREEKK